MTHQHTLKTRSLALFVTVFVCLNAAGAACIAYCQTMDAPAETAVHCPLKRAALDCAGQGSFAAIEGHQLDCCPMTVSLLAAPLEKHSFTLKKPAAVPVLRFDASAVEAAAFAPLSSAISYRGPPPIDRRTDRIKQRLLLI